MGDIASWGPKGFLVSPNKIVPFEGLSTSVSVKEDSEKDTSGTSPTNAKGLNLQPISFSTTYFRGAGVDPRAQWEEWCDLVGQSYPLYIGGERFGPSKIKLKSADLSAVQTDNNGRFVMASIGLTFEEDPTGQPTTNVSPTKVYTSTTSTTSTSTDAAQKAAAVYKETVEKKRAMSTGATAADKAAKK